MSGRWLSALVLPLVNVGLAFAVSALFLEMITTSTSVSPARSLMASRPRTSGYPVPGGSVSRT